MTLEQKFKKETGLDAYIPNDLRGHIAIDTYVEWLEEQLSIPRVMHRFSTPEKMAEWLHNNYEEIALNNGWKTQDDCQVPFCDLPTENRLTMIELCIRYLNGA